LPPSEFALLARTWTRDRLSLRVVPLKLTA